MLGVDVLPMLDEGTEQPSSKYKHQGFIDRYTVCDSRYLLLGTTGFAGLVAS